MQHSFSPSGSGTLGRSLAFRLAALALIAVTLTGASGFLMARWLTVPEDGVPTGPSSAIAKGPANHSLFRDWPTDRKPDLVLLLSGQMHGYLQPCGCSKPQLGGLVRRYNFLHALAGERGWPVAAVDLGDLIDPPAHRGAQKLVKYRFAMEALKRMNYLGVGVGLYETEMPLLTVVAEYALQPGNDKPPMLAANLLNKKPNYADAIKSWTVSDGQAGKPRIGTVAIIGPTVAKQITAHDPSAQFGPTEQVLPMALRDFQNDKAEFLVLLYQGSVKEAKACAGRFPQFHVILCQSDDPPSDKPERLPDPTAKGAGALRKQPLIIGVGHKGSYVGVVGAYRTGRAEQLFELHYQLAALGEEYETPKDKTNPIEALMEDYAREIKDGNYLAQHPRSKHPLQVDYPTAKYVGSDRCLRCHKEAAKVWKNTPHFHAYRELVTATKPSLRQYDSECVRCHVVGFDHEGGFTNEKQTPHLMNVGCESCHGPGSLHAAGGDVRDAKLMRLMNPYRRNPKETEEDAKRRKYLIDQSCQKCHDQDNDVHWDFDKKWPKIVHHEN